MNVKYDGRLALFLAVTSLSLAGSVRMAQAFNYEFDNGVDVRFDNTIEYSVIERTAPEAPYIQNSINANDGDNNLRAGIVSNKADLITAFNISYQGFGFDASADSFYDTVYNQKTQNGSGATYNPAQQPADKFTNATQTQAGRNIEARNLFVYGTETVGNVPVTLRVGRLVNLYGESLLFGQNGISYGQAPLDIQQAVSVPNTQVKNLFLPVGQALISAQLTDAIAVTAYYQFEWEKFNLQPAGSFFSIADLLDEGGERIIAQPLGTPGLPPGSAAYFYRSNDIRGSNTGQFGASLHFEPAGTNWDFGFYALQYNDSEPQVYTQLHKIVQVAPGVFAPQAVPVAGGASGSPAPLSIGNYQLVYANGIQIYGVSTSTTVGPLNLAGEASIRANEDLRSTVTLQAGQTAGNNDSDALYAIGDVAHYQISEIYLGPKVPRFWDSSAVIGEVAGENLFAITKNKQNFDTVDARHMALGLRTIASVTYYEALPGLDLSPSIGLGWNFMGMSPDTTVFNNTGIDRGGDITLGVSGVYVNKWTANIGYTRYIAPPARDPFADRDFVTASIQRTF